MAGAIWTNASQLQTMMAAQGHEPPAQELCYRMLTERWFANPDNLEDLVELLRPGQTGTPPTPRHHSSSAVPAGRSRKASGDNAGPGPAAPDWNDTPEGRAAAHRQRSMSYNSGSGSGSGSAAASPPTNPLNA